MAVPLLQKETAFWENQAAERTLCVNNYVKKG